MWRQIVHLKPKAYHSFIDNLWRTGLGLSEEKRIFSGDHTWNNVNVVKNLHCIAKNIVNNWSLHNLTLLYCVYIFALSEKLTFHHPISMIWEWIVQKIVIFFLLQFSSFEVEKRPTVRIWSWQGSRSYPKQNSKRWNHQISLAILTSLSQAEYDEEPLGSKGFK